MPLTAPKMSFGHSSSVVLTMGCPCLWTFLVLEYIGSTLVPALGYLAVLAELAAFIALAREIRHH